MRIAFSAFLLVGVTAGASDKGIKAEMVSASVSLFCSTSIADDLKPIVEGEEYLAVAKMSQESLKEATERLNQQWQSVATKHRAAIEQLALTPRLQSVDSGYVELAAKEAWGEIQKQCPAKAKDGGPHEVTTFLKRRIPELKWKKE
jgi:hypothetical protein